MLTQEAVRSQLDTIANELSRQPGIYYELFSLLFSARVHNWILSVPGAEACLIERVAENDPDYLAEIDEIDIDITRSIAAPEGEAIFNQDWDVSY